MSGGQSRRDAASGRSRGRQGLNYRCCPCATGGRSLSLLTVFLPTCSPPLSRKKASAIAITAPIRAPSFPLGARLSVIKNLRSSALMGPTPASDRGSCAGRTRVELRQTCGAPAQRLTKMHGGLRAPSPDIELSNVDDRTVGEIEPDQGRQRRLGGRHRHGDPCPGDLAVEAVLRRFDSLRRRAQ